MSRHLVAIIAASVSAPASTAAVALCRAALTPARAYALLLPPWPVPDDALARAASIIVCGWEWEADVPLALLDSLRSAHARGARLAAIGGGTALLAAAGLLDGRRAATSPAAAVALAYDYPAVDVRPDALLIDAGGLLTASDDGARELLLWMVQRDCGAVAAAELKEAWQEIPEQEQEQEQEQQQEQEAGLAALLAHLRAHPAEAHTEAAMAARAGLPAAELHQRFIDATGLVPEAWLASERAALLRRLLA